MNKNALLFGQLHRTILHTPTNVLQPASQSVNKLSPPSIPPFLALKTCINLAVAKLVVHNHLHIWPCIDIFTEQSGLLFESFSFDRANDSSTTGYVGLEFARGMLIELE